MKIQRMHCETCDKVTKCVSDRARHGLHGVLTLLTGGLWGLVWISSTSKANSLWNCEDCGEGISNRVVNQIKWQQWRARMKSAFMIPVKLVGVIVAGLVCLMGIGAITEVLHYFAVL